MTGSCDLTLWCQLAPWRSRTRIIRSREFDGSLKIFYSTGISVGNQPPSIPFLWHTLRVPRSRRWPFRRRLSSPRGNTGQRRPSGWKGVADNGDGLAAIPSRDYGGIPGQPSWFRGELDTCGTESWRQWKGFSQYMQGTLLQNKEDVSEGAKNPFSSKDRSIRIGSKWPAKRNFQTRPNLVFFFFFLNAVKCFTCHILL